MYGAAEASLGDVLRGRRVSATLPTKVWAAGVAEGRAQYLAQRRFDTVQIPLTRPSEAAWLGPDERALVERLARA